MIEIDGAVYAHGSKGHDRLVIDTEHNFFAVLDGAGGDELSQAAVEYVPTAITTAQAEGGDQPRFLARVAQQLDNHIERHRRKSTAAMAVVSQQGDSLQLSYLNLGDSSLFLWNQVTDEFGCVGHTKTEYFRQGDTWYIDTADFLGAGRSLEELAAKVGHLVLPLDTRWTLVGVTDGVVDDSGQGIIMDQLEILVRQTPTVGMAQRILDRVEKFDDAAVFVLSH